MLIKPKIRGFICTTTHPVGCEANVKEQIAYTQAQGPIANAPKRVLVVGSSSGYGLSSRVAAAFGGGAATIGVFYEKPATDKKPGTAGYYNAAAFDKLAHEAGLYAKSLNGDAFSNEAKQKAIELIKDDLGQVDMVVYSLASPVRKLPETGELVRSSLKPIGQTYTSTAVDTNRDVIIEASVEPATEQEIADTVTVMGGQDWELWIEFALAGFKAKNLKATTNYYRKHANNSTKSYNTFMTLDSHLSILYGVGQYDSVVHQVAKHKVSYYAALMSYDGHRLRIGWLFLTIFKNYPNSLNLSALSCILKNILLPQSIRKTLSRVKRFAQIRS